MIFISPLSRVFCSQKIFFCKFSARWDNKDFLPKHDTAPHLQVSRARILGSTFIWPYLDLDLHTTLTVKLALQIWRCVLYSIRHSMFANHFEISQSLEKQSNLEWTVEAALVCWLFWIKVKTDAAKPVIPLITELTWIRTSWYWHTETQRMARLQADYEYVTLPGVD